MQKFRITFIPDNRTVDADRDSTILAAALSAGIAINSACGGDGVCGRCKVRVRSGTVSIQAGGTLTLEEKESGICLACMTALHSDAEIEILPESRLDYGMLSKEETAFRLKGLYSGSEEVAGAPEHATAQFAHGPLTEKLYLELPRPDLRDSVSDLDRVYRQIRKARELPHLTSSLTIIRRLGELLRDADWKITATLGRKNGGAEIIIVDAGDTTGVHYGICFDIGTTTITGQLVDLAGRRIVGTKATYNKQAVFGSDVVTRILHSRQANGLEQLHDAVIDTMNEIIGDLLAEHRVDRNGVTAVVCAGNTTMLHLLLSIDPAYIRREPYIPTANLVPVTRAMEAQLRINPRGLLSCMPGVSSYVGADIVAGVLSSGLYKETNLSLLIDIGTNGEIVLGNREFMTACAASAGPAFEGSGVTCGMRAGAAAIQKARVDPATFAVSWETIGGGKPAGICGSGYIALLEQMLRTGVMDKSGKLALDGHPLVRCGETGKEFVVVPKEDAASSGDIVITETDIENLKRAKGAIYSAIEVLLEYMDLPLSGLKKIFIAGGFGTYLDIESAIAIGLLPDLDRSRFAFIGNSSLAGAREALLSAEAAATAVKLAGEITYCELSAYPGYMDAYTASLFFPHTDLKKFPSVNARRPGCGS